MMQSLYTEWQNTVTRVIEEIGFSSDEVGKISLALIAFFEVIALFTIVLNKKKKQIDEILKDVKLFLNNLQKKRLNRFEIPNSTGVIIYWQLQFGITELKY